MAIILVRMQCSHVSLPPCYLTVLRTRWECGERKGLQQIWRLFWGQPGRRKLLTRDDARRIAVEGAPALRGKSGRQPVGYAHYVNALRQALKQGRGGFAHAPLPSGL
jgi:hypothetical protein